MDFEMVIALNPCNGSVWTSANRKSVFEWLFGKRGYCEMASDDEPDRFYMVCLTGIDGLNTTNGENGYVKISGTMLPFSYKKYSSTFSVISGGSISVTSEQNFRNQDDTRYNYPEIIITITSAPTTGTIQIGTLTIDNCANGEVITINNELKTIHSSINGYSKAGDSNFSWVRLDNGINSIPYTGSSANITVNARYKMIM